LKIKEDNKMYGCLREDGDGHWYLIPEDKLESFKAAKFAVEQAEIGFNTRDWEEACDMLIDNFYKYRLSGGPYDLRIEIKDD